MKVSANPLGEHFAAEIVGCDLRSLRDEDDVKAIVSLVDKHQVVVFRDQQLRPDELINAAQRLGPLQSHILDQFRLESHPQIYVLSNVQENGKPIGNANDGITWHTDLAGDVNARVYTMLYAVEVPPVGGDTVFASTQTAWDRLPDGDKRDLEKLTATYSYEQLYNSRREMLAKAGIDNDYAPLTDEQIKAAQKMRRVEPVVRTHPNSGRKGLYLGTLSFESIEGLDAEKGREKMVGLVDYATGEEFRYSHKWRRGDVVLWDNRGLLHVATPYDKAKYRRVIYRLSVEGSPPV
jgi:Probable taurine catabolism dioxygenase